MFAAGAGSVGQTTEATLVQKTTLFRANGWFSYSLINQIVSGNLFSLVITNSGALMGFGSNQYGQLGTGGVNSAAYPTPISIATGTLAGKTFNTAAACYYHSMAIDSTGIIHTVRSIFPYFNLHF
jgi:alpha-tubulin suppressor-like RCC1 family protein